MKTNGDEIMGKSLLKLLTPKINELKNNNNEEIINNSEKNNNNKNSINNYINYELCLLTYEEAIILDKRNYIEYYFSLLNRKQIIFFTFNNKDYNSIYVKICCFFFSFSLSFAINTLFFNNKNLDKINEDKGKFNIIYQIPIILYSSIISCAFNSLISFLSFSDINIIEFKNLSEKANLKEYVDKLKNNLKIKFIIFFIIIFIFLILFWFYISSFCAIYVNTQIYLIKDTLINFGFSLVYPFGLCLLPGIFRIPSLRGKNQDKKCLYNFSKFIQ